MQSDIKSKSLKALREILKAQGIKGYSRMDRKTSEMLVARLSRPVRIECAYVSQNHQGRLSVGDHGAKLTPRQARRIKKAANRASKVIGGEI